MYIGSCHKLVAKGTFKGKWFKLPQEQDNVALFYKKVQLDFYELFILYSFVYFWFTKVIILGCLSRILKILLITIKLK